MAPMILMDGFDQETLTIRAWSQCAQSVGWRAKDDALGPVQMETLANAYFDILRNPMCSPSPSQLHCAISCLNPSLWPETVPARRCAPVTSWHIPADHPRGLIMMNGLCAGTRWRLTLSRAT